MPALLVINEIPDSLKMYFLPVLTADETAVLQKCHGKYMCAKVEEVEVYIRSVMYATADKDTKNGWLDSGSLLDGWEAKDWSKCKLATDTDIARITSHLSIRIIVTGVML